MEDKEKENQPTSCHKERLSVGDSSIKLNADDIKISANSIKLHQQNHCS